MRLLREVVVLREVALAAEELVVAVGLFVVEGLRGYSYIIFIIFTIFTIGKLGADGQGQPADRPRTSARFVRDGKILHQESLEF